MNSFHSRHLMKCYFMLNDLFWFILFCFIAEMGEDKKDSVLQTEKSLRFCVLEILENPGGNKKWVHAVFLPPKLGYLKKKKFCNTDGFLWDVRNKIVI